MANIKSAKKRAKTNEIRRKRNIARRSDLKTSTKKFLDAIEKSNFDEAKILLKEVESKISRAKGKGLLKKNCAARKVGRLAKKLSNALKK